MYMYNHENAWTVHAYLSVYMTVFKKISLILTLTKIGVEVSDHYVVH